MEVSRLTRVVAIFAIAVLAGCASYPRYVDGDQENDVSSLMQAFGIQGQHEAVDLQVLSGNTLRSEIKVLITDRAGYKRYFGSAGRVFVQDEGFIVYGFLPIPTGDKYAKGEVGSYGINKGIMVITSGMCGTERLLMTRQKTNGENACWFQSCRNPAGEKSWAKWDCTLEKGNTLRAN